MTRSYGEKSKVTGLGRTEIFGGETFNSQTLVHSEDEYLGRHHKNRIDISPVDIMEKILVPPEVRTQ